MHRVIALFRSTHSVIRAERLCLENGLYCKVIAVPRTVSSECGIALEIKQEQMAELSGMLSKSGIPFNCHRLTEDR
ncbi:MAG: DUF3343 domain-containing protein [Chitinispirillaceae bacterium]|nr:DUF3343 domain-containing protein [Chitinispirillaceae bacterium]